MKTLSIIGIIITVLFIPFIIYAVLTQGRINFDEFAPVAVLYSLYMLALSIAGVIKK